MKITIITILAFLSLIFTLQAQNLNYPTKDCQGASVTPDDLYSWCHDSKDEYYNECECKFERALKDYHTQKEKLETKLEALYTKSDELKKKARNERDQSVSIASKINNESTNFEADKNSAISHLGSAIAYWEQVIEIREEINQVGRRIHGSQYGNNKKYEESIIENLRDEIDVLENKKQIKTSDVSISLSNNAESGNNQHSSSNWDEAENDKANTNESYTEEFEYQKRQRETRQVEERRLAQRRAEEKRVRDAIDKQNREIEQKERAIAQGVGNATSTISNAIGDAMDANRKRQEEKSRIEDQARRAKERLIADRREQAYNEWGRFHCQLNEYLTNKATKNTDLYCSVFEPKGELSLQNAIDKAKRLNKEFIYFTYLILRTQKNEGGSYSVVFDYTKPHQFPYNQLQYLDGNYSDKLTTLYNRARKESLWDNKSNVWGEGNLGKVVVKLLFSDSQLGIDKAINEITNMINLPVNLEPDDYALDNWEFIDFERGANLVELAKNNQIGTGNNYIYKTEDNEVIYLNDGKFILLKNGEQLSEYLNIDGEKIPHQVQPSIEGNKLTIHSWQKTILRTYATYKNMFLKLDGYTYPGWMNYSLSPSKDLYKVPLAFWDWGGAGEVNNAVYILNKRNVKKLFFENPSSTYRVIDIDADSYLPTGMFRPAIAYGTYQVESENDNARIKFNYQGAFNWSAAVHIKGLQEADKVKGVVRLIQPERNMNYPKYYIYDSYEPYSWSDYTDHPNKENLGIQSTDPLVFQKYFITDWEIVYQYNNLRVKEDGDVDRWLEVKRKLGYGENYFPQQLSSDETYKVFTQTDQIVEAVYNPNKRYITLNNEDDFNEIFEVVKHFAEQTNNDIGKGYFNSNLFKNPEGKSTIKEETQNDNNPQSKPVTNVNNDKNSSLQNNNQPKKSELLKDRKTSFPGGETALIEYFSENMQYPEEAIASQIEGTVYVSFTVSKDGSLNEVKVMRGPGFGLNKEAVRLIQNMPKWKPAIEQGKIIVKTVYLPLKFELPKDSISEQKAILDFWKKAQNTLNKTKEEAETP